MEKKIIKGKIGNAITSVAEDHIVVVSEDVFDEKHQKYQSEINDIAIGGTKWEGEYERGTKVLFDRLKSNLAQCINDGTIYFVKDSNGNFTQIALGDGSKSHVVGIGPKMDDATKQDLMSKLGLTISSDMRTIQLGKLANHNGVSSQKKITYERTGLGTDTYEISTVGYVQQYMQTAKAMVYAGVFNAQTKEITDYNNAIISPSGEGNVTFDYLLNGNEGETLLTPGMSFIVGTAGDLEGYTGISVYGGQTKAEVGDMIIIINVQQKEGNEGGSTYNEASILIIQNTNLKIADGAITTAKLADAAVTASKLSTDIQSLISNLSKTATFSGIATPTTNPGTPDGPVFYIANGKGTYTNFGGIDVTEEEVVILYYDTNWHKDATGIASQEKLIELDQKVEEIIPPVIYTKKTNVSNVCEIGTQTSEDGKIIGWKGEPQTTDGYTLYTIQVSKPCKVYFETDGNNFKNLPVITIASAIINGTNVGRKRLIRTTTSIDENTLPSVENPFELSAGDTMYISMQSVEKDNCPYTIIIEGGEKIFGDILLNNNQVAQARNGILKDTEITNILQVVGENKYAELAEIKDNYNVGWNDIAEDTTKSWKTYVIKAKEDVDIYFSEDDVLSNITMIYTLFSKSEPVEGKKRKEYKRNETNTLPTQQSPYSLKKDEIIYVGVIKAETDEIIESLRYRVDDTKKELVAESKENYLPQLMFSKKDKMSIYVNIKGTNEYIVYPLRYRYAPFSSGVYPCFMDNWGISNAYSALYNNGVMTYNKSLFSAGETECASRVEDTRGAEPINYVGGAAHGYENIVNGENGREFRILIDGITVGESDIVNLTECSRIDVYQNTEVFQLNTTTNPWCKLLKHWEWHDGEMRITTEMLILRDIKIFNAQMGMVCVYRHLEGNSSYPYVTNKLIKGNNLFKTFNTSDGWDDQDLSSADNSCSKMIASGELGYSFSFAIVDDNRKPNGGMFCFTNPNGGNQSSYNKMYFDVCGNYNAQIGDVLKATQIWTIGKH